MRTFQGDLYRQICTGIGQIFCKFAKTEEVLLKLFMNRKQLIVISSKF